MSRSDSESAQSPYYPPRARWYGRLFFRPQMALRRALHLESLRLPDGFSFGQLLLSVLVPGYALFVGGRRMLGWVFVSAYVLAAVVLVVALGYQLGALAYGILISVHATSIVFLEGHWLRDARFSLRLTLALATLVAVWLLIYSPLRHYVERHWVRPVLIHNRVVLVKPHASGWTPQRGDWVMYALVPGSHNQFWREGGVVVRAGLGWGPVLAVAGDHVSFSTNSFSVNGVELPRRAIMPTGGDLVIPENRWLIWPEMGISGAGRQTRADMVMLELATVSERQFVGTPFKRWFWRRQEMP